MKDILDGKKVTINIYDYRTNSVDLEKTVTIYPADVVLFEGILVFYFPEIRELFHMKLFVDTDSDTRLARRVPRDIKERGRDLDQVLNQYMLFVKPAFEEFCSPTKKWADVIIPRGADNIGKLFEESFFIFQKSFWHLDIALGYSMVRVSCSRNYGNTVDKKKTR